MVCEDSSSVLIPPAVTSAFADPSVPVGRSAIGKPPLSVFERQLGAFASCLPRTPMRSAELRQEFAGAGDRHAPHGARSRAERGWLSFAWTTRPTQLRQKSIPISTPGASTRKSPQMAGPDAPCHETARPSRKATSPASRDDVGQTPTATGTTSRRPSSVTWHSTRLDARTARPTPAGKIVGEAVTPVFGIEAHGRDYGAGAAAASSRGSTR